MNKLKAGLIGCGDYLRWEIDEIKNSKYFEVTRTYDLDSKKSQKRAQELGAKVTENIEDIFNDSEISIVCIFTPPWVREDYFKKAIEKEKHIITTKPLANNLESGERLLKSVGDKIKCAVFYGRSGNSAVEQLKRVFDSGEIGKLALYKEDWFHHFPQWNNWATDKEKNGGPFMDAMVHNLNKARYLIGSKVKELQFNSDNLAQNLKCNDTESMTLRFENGSMSMLFITWAADLEVFSLKGNEREHYGISHMISDKGWYVKIEDKEDGAYVTAKKEHEIKSWKVIPNAYTRYDEVSLGIQGKIEMPYDIKDAIIDLKILFNIG